jgi:hypothetical protein
MNRFLAMFVTLFALALSFGGCAEPDHPRNEEGGRIWTTAEMVAEGASDGTGVGPTDSCDDGCCLPYVCTFFCCNQPGGGGGGGDSGGGGGSCATKCGSIAKCSQHGPWCLAFCPGSCGPR